MELGNSGFRIIGLLVGQEKRFEVGAVCRVIIKNDEIASISPYQESFGWFVHETPDQFYLAVKGKPVVRRGRKASGLRALGR